MKRAIVLGGGGSKGAYHIGAWSALNQQHIHYDIVTGTSIGAMIGVLMVQQDYSIAKNLWDHMTLDQVIAGGLNLDISIDSFIDQKNNILPFIKHYINEKGADITPLKQMIHHLYDPKRFYQSPIDYGLIMTSYPSLKKVEKIKKDIPPDELEDVVIASGSCFPAFPIHKIDQQSYIDGGYSDNVPIDLAFKMNADEVIAIDLANTIKHPLAYFNPCVTYIHSYHDLGSMLDFNEQRLAHNQWLGYYDTLKTFQQYVGYYYTFEKDFVPTFKKTLNVIEAYLHEYKTFNDHSFIDVFMDYVKKPSLNNMDFDIIPLEILAESIHLDPYHVYTFSHVHTLIMDFFSDPSIYHYETFLKNISNPKLLYDTFKDYEQSYLIGCIYHALKQSHALYRDIKRFNTLSSKMTLCALYLLHLDSQFNL